MTTCTTAQEQPTEVEVATNDQTTSGILDSILATDPDHCVRIADVGAAAATPQVYNSQLFREQAISLRSFGFNVLPVVGKNPGKLLKHWQEHQNDLQPLEVIQNYPWERATGLAIVLGVGDIHSGDIDGVKDDSVLYDFLKLLGLAPDYEWVEKTGSGYQVFFICRASYGDKGSEDRASNDCRCVHIELRWKNCISVVPPSAHYDKQKPDPKPDGKFYSWVNGRPSHMPAEIGMDIVERAYKALTKDRPARPIKEHKTVYEWESPVGRAILNFRMEEYLDARGIDWCEEVGGKRQIRIEYQPGHSSLLWTDELHCSRLMRTGDAMGLIDTIAFLELCKEEKEFEGFEALDGTKKQFVFEMLQKYSGIDLSNKGFKLSGNHPIKVWDKDELLNANLPDLVELIEGVMSDEGVYLFAGQDKAGKSLFGMNLALSIASDREQFLGWRIKKHGSVVYFNNELSDRQIYRRLRSMNIPTPHPVKFINEKGVRFDEHIEVILKICREYKPVLVVVDCHYRTTSKDKDYGNAIQAVLENYTRIKEEVGCALLIIHHTKKSARGERAGSEQAMGSHTFAMMTDGNFQLKRSETEPEKRILFENGSRDFSGIKPRLIELNDLNLWFKDLGECDEEDHMAREGGRAKTVDNNVVVKLLEKVPLTKWEKKDVIRTLVGQGNSTATIYRHFKAAEDQLLVKTDRDGNCWLLNPIGAAQETKVCVEANAPESEAVSADMMEVDNENSF